MAKERGGVQTQRPCRYVLEVRQGVLQNVLRTRGGCAFTDGYDRSDFKRCFDETFCREDSGELTVNCRSAMVRRALLPEDALEKVVNSCRLNDFTEDFMCFLGSAARYHRHQSESSLNQLTSLLNAQLLAGPLDPVDRKALAGLFGMPCPASPP
eukprot:Cvel_464.t1-p1 / transcript=Cvel_464.t1 / gene=Cvel_464 / organism=Chromera_velia_CCMP2878 / gene_product=hypothetical protein / transcript_product=hypothetical protein / location=Cvel_scaffold14:229625-230834(+) / protein_length=153 / sequence_SO=supercontig / SO=protein_coding / is_pseudo=false